MKSIRKYLEQTGKAPEQVVRFEDLLAIGALEEPADDAGTQARASSPAKSAKKSTAKRGR